MLFIWELKVNNPRVFGFGSDEIKAATIDSLAEKLQAPQSLDLEIVHKTLGDCIFADNEGFPVMGLSFPDPQVNSSLLTKVVAKLPGHNISFLGEITPGTSKGKIASIPDEDLSFLSPFERVKLTQAIKAGYTPTVNSLLKKIEDAKNKKAQSKDKDQDSTTSADTLGSPVPGDPSVSAEVVETGPENKINSKSSESAQIDKTLRSSVPEYPAVPSGASPLPRKIPELKVTFLLVRLNKPRRSRDGGDQKP